MSYQETFAIYYTFFFLLFFFLKKKTKYRYMGVILG